MCYCSPGAQRELQLRQLLHHPHHVVTPLMWMTAALIQQPKGCKQQPTCEEMQSVLWSTGSYSFVCTQMSSSQMYCQYLILKIFSRHVSIVSISSYFSVSLVPLVLLRIGHLKPAICCKYDYVSFKTFSRTMDIMIIESDIRTETLIHQNQNPSKDIWSHIWRSR